MESREPLLHVIDTTALKKFQQREARGVGMPQEIREELSLNRSLSCHEAPEAAYQNGEGYEFSWGHILERRSGPYLIWDYCFSPLLLVYLQQGKRLSDLQKDMFLILEKSQLDCITRDIVQVLRLTSGWKIVPCSSVGVFSQIIHFTDEHEARKWTLSHLLHPLLPELVNRLHQHVRTLI